MRLDRALAPKSPRIWASDRERERERDRPDFASSLLDVGDETAGERDGAPKGNKERRVLAEKELRRFKSKVRPSPFAASAGPERMACH